METTVPGPLPDFQGLGAREVASAVLVPEGKPLARGGRVTMRLTRGLVWPVVALGLVFCGIPLDSGNDGRGPSPTASHDEEPGPGQPDPSQGPEGDEDGTPSLDPAEPDGLIQSLGGGVIRVGLDDGSGAPLTMVESEATGGRINQVVEQIGALPSVKAATIVDGRLKVEANQAQDALLGVLELTNKLDVRITMLEILEPNLEGVFLHLTGKKLRE